MLFFEIWLERKNLFENHVAYGFGNFKIKLLFSQKAIPTI